MKNFFAVVLILSVLSSCSDTKTKNNNFSINGNVDGDFHGQVYLYKRDAGEWIILDSAIVENGSFQFTGNIGLPEMYYLNLENSDQFASVFVEQADIVFHSSIEDFRISEISGSVSQAEYEIYKEKSNIFNDQLNTAWQNIKTARSEGDKDAETKWETEYDDIEIAQKSFILDYGRSNNSSVVSAYIILSNVYYYNETDLEPIIAGFNPSIQESVYVKGLTDRVETLQRVSIGNPAVDFTMNDLEGNPVTLSSLYGDYLLVDFWASWCGPCRRENPNIVAVYDDFKEKGFNILGVSFDKEKTKWAEAIIADDLTWLHVSDLKGWGNEAGKLYAVSSIPSNVLLDPEGIIVAKNLRGEDLRIKLEELLVN